MWEFFREQPIAAVFICAFAFWAIASVARSLAIAVAANRKDIDGLAEEDD